MRSHPPSGSPDRDLSVPLAVNRIWDVGRGPTRHANPTSVTARLFEAYRAYFQAVRDAYLHPGLEHDLARTTLEASIARLRLEPGESPGRLTTLQAMLADSHRFIHAVMSLEAGLFRSQPVPARPQFATFANSVDSTLYFLTSYLRGVPVKPGDLPDLREDHRALLQSGNSRTERSELVNVESDRVTNSLNTLSVELTQWLGSSAV